MKVNLPESIKSRPLVAATVVVALALALLYAVVDLFGPDKPWALIEQVVTHYLKEPTP